MDNPNQLDFNGNCPPMPYLSDPMCGDACTPVGLPCEISINPVIFKLKSGESLKFTASENNGCNDPDYEWSVESDIGSEIDQSGNYSAGINLDLINDATDIIRVVDHGNGDVTVEATIIVSWKCFLLQFFGEASEEIELLRKFRDSVLSKTPAGREMIRLYYHWSPVIVKAMEGDEEFKKAVKDMVDEVLPLIKGSVR